MIVIEKTKGQTPLEALEEFRRLVPDLKNQTLSYIGRLDPLAEGKMIVLVGKEENALRENYMNFDKEYLATFCLGFSTDTGDLMGLVGEESTPLQDPTLLMQKVPELLETLKSVKSQKYPWFSSKHILGKPLFHWFKKGETAHIQRPTKDIEIYEAELINISEITGKGMLIYLEENIKKVRGDFRQTQIIEKWHQTLLGYQNQTYNLLSLRLKVSSGTYIRALCQEIQNYLGVPAVLYHLKRQEIFIPDSFTGK